MLVDCPGNFEVITGEGPLPMAIFELLEYIVNEVMSDTLRHRCVSPLCNNVLAILHGRGGRERVVSPLQAQSFSRCAIDV